MDKNTPVEPSRWPHRAAVLLCIMTFPLLWVGGLITSTDAGMAVPDWPGTYGYNMFLYPLETWFFGPWDLFIEHGHRLLASLVGLVTIGLLITVWRTDRRPWMRWLSVGLLAMVIAQGVLGGLRVVLNERMLAMIHGSFGPLFFACTTATVVLTARPAKFAGNQSAGLYRIAALTALLTYGQLILGAWLRHFPETGDPFMFALAVKLHLSAAAIVTIAVVAPLLSSHKAVRQGCVSLSQRVVSLAMGAVVLLQVGLGIGAWLTKYGSPAWAGTWLTTMMGANQAGGLAQTHVVTGHSANGSLLLGLSVALAVSLSRTRASVATDKHSATHTDYVDTSSTAIASS